MVWIQNHVNVLNAIEIFTPKWLKQYILRYVYFNHNFILKEKNINQAVYLRFAHFSTYKSFFFKKPTQSLVVIVTLWKLSKHGVFPFVGLANISIS